MNDSTETNCTRVTVRQYGSESCVTIRDHEIEKLAIYIAQHEAVDAIITTERGVWIE